MVPGIQGRFGIQNISLLHNIRVIIDPSSRRISSVSCNDSETIRNWVAAFARPGRRVLEHSYAHMAKALYDQNVNIVSQLENLTRS